MNDNSPRKVNVHDGHRNRVRNNVLVNGYSQLEDHRLLELLLFYAVPRGDTNELAHILLDRFGSLSGVIGAPKEELMSVKGVGESTVVFLNSLSELTLRVSSQSVKKRRTYRTPEALTELARSLYFNETTEKPYVLCFDSGMRLLCKKLLDNGNSDSSEIKQRVITQAVITSDASFAVLVHNHPFSSSEPSYADIETTRTTAVLLRKIGVALCDHIIVGCDGECSVFSLVEDLSYVLDKTILTDDSRKKVQE